MTHPLPPRQNDGGQPGHPGGQPPSGQPYPPPGQPYPGFPPSPSGQPYPPAGQAYPGFPPPQPGQAYPGPAGQAYPGFQPYPGAYPGPWPPAQRPARIQAAGAGTAYHRLAGTPAHRWWRPVVGTLLVVGGGFVAMGVLGVAWMIAGYLADRPEGPDGFPTFGATADLALTLVSLALLIPFALLGARWVQARPAGTVSSVLGRLRWRWLGACLLLALPTIGLMLAGMAGLLAVTGEPFDLGGEGWVGTRTFLIGLVVLAPLVPLQAAGEEYLFRGWLLQAVGAYLRTPWVPILVQSVLFAAAHGWGTSWGFVDLMVFGVVTGWLTVRTGGLEAAIGLHVVNNLVAMVTAAAVGALDSTETAADAPWQMLVADVVVLIGYALVVRWLARRCRIDRTVPEPVGPAGDLRSSGAPAEGLAPAVG